MLNFIRGNCLYFLSNIINKDKKIHNTKCPLCASMDYTMVYNRYDIVQCQRCKFIYSKKQIKDPKKFYSSAYLEESRENQYVNVGAPIEAIENLLQHDDASYFHDYVASKKISIDDIMKRIDISSEEEALEIGGGWGYFAFHLVKSGIQTTVFELCSDNCRIGQKLGICMRNEDFLEAKIKENHFKFCYMIHSLEHVKEPRKYIIKLHSALKQGGYIYISVPNWDSYWHKQSKESWEWLDPTAHLSYFTHRTLCKLLEDSHFEVFESGTSMVLGTDQPNYIWALQDPNIKDKSAIVEFLREQNKEHRGESVYVFARKI